VLLYAHHDVQPAAMPKLGRVRRSNPRSATGASMRAARPTTRPASCAHLGRGFVAQAAGFERRTLPSFGIARGLHVMVRVEQHRGLSWRLEEIA